MSIDKFSGIVTLIERNVNGITNRRDSGNRILKDFFSNGGDINVTGSGDVRVNSKGSVSTTIMGSGEVHNIGSSGDGPHTD